MKHPTPPEPDTQTSGADADLQFGLGERDLLGGRASRCHGWRRRWARRSSGSSGESCSRSPWRRWPWWDSYPSLARADVPAVVSTGLGRVSRAVRLLGEREDLVPRPAARGCSLEPVPVDPCHAPDQCCTRAGLPHVEVGDGAGPSASEPSATTCGAARRRGSRNRMPRRPADWGGRVRMGSSNSSTRDGGQPTLADHGDQGTTTRKPL